MQRRSNVGFTFRSDESRGTPSRLRPSPKFTAPVLGPPEERLKNEEVEMFVFGVKSNDPTRSGIWLLAGDGKAHHVPKPEDLVALTKGVTNIGDMSEDFLLRFERIHPELGNLP